jgi:hypothetical protein
MQSALQSSRLHCDICVVYYELGFGRATIMNADAALALGLMLALLLAFSLQGLAASGHFPKSHRAAALASRGGAIVLHGSIAVSALSLLIGVIAVWRRVPWYAGVIGGGLVLLGAPLVLRLMSDAVVNSRALLIGLAGISFVFAIMLVLLRSPG